MSAVPTITLNDGKSIPQLGFGVFQIEPADTARAVGVALDVGYRHIDTAEMYQNEKQVGQGVRASGLDRSEVFVTSKLNNGFHRPDDARSAFAGTLAALDMDYVDLFLIHWPLPTLYGGDFVATWKVLEEFRSDGRARSIGVSNFQTAHLQRLAAESDTVPAVNQIEAHPYFTNDEVRDYGRSHGIATEAWSPIAQGAVLDDPVIGQVAARVGRTPGAGRPALAHPARRHRVPQVDDAGADQGELRAVRLRAGGRGRRSDHRSGPGRGGRTGPNPDTFALPPRLRLSGPRSARPRRLALNRAELATVQGK